MDLLSNQFNQSNAFSKPDADNSSSISRYLGSNLGGNPDSIFGDQSFADILGTQLTAFQPINSKVDSILQRLENNQPLVGMTDQEAASMIFDAIKQILSGVADAMKMLNSFLEKKLVTPSAVIGFWPANSDCDDIILYKDDSRNEMIEKFYNLRQQVNRTKSNRANFCLSDFVAPRKSGLSDYVGGFLVTVFRFETLIFERSVSFSLSRHTFQSCCATTVPISPTPLISLNKLNEKLNFNKIYYKDESKRFHLKSFKALGGAYAVEKIIKGNDKKVISTATAGNHGRSVAWGSQKNGLECKIFISEFVSESRAEVMRNFGADVIKIEQPGEGDMLRMLSGISGFETGTDWFWELDGRNKRSIALDLKSDEGIAVLRKLVSDCDIFITNQPYIILPYLSFPPYQKVSQQ